MQLKSSLQKGLDTLFDIPSPPSQPISPMSLVKEEGIMDCNTCWYGMLAFDQVFKAPLTISKVENFGEYLCANYFVNNSTMCSAVKMMGDILLPVLADTVLGSDFFCAQVLGVCDSPHYQFLPSEDYVKKILNKKPKSLTSNDYLNKLYSKMKIQPNKERKLLRAVQISDPHIDFEYTVGSIADCGLPLCCRPENGFISDPELQAKYWGDYKCDLPHNTLVHMLNFVKTEIKPDMFIWTGDNSAHTVWKNDLQEVIDYT